MTRPDTARARLSADDLADLVAQHIFTSISGMGTASRSYCSCGVEYSWEDRHAAHAMHHFEVIAAEHAARLAAFADKVEGRLTQERDRARTAYKAANSDHFADDYSRWVGHAEAGSNAIVMLHDLRREVLG